MAELLADHASSGPAVHRGGGHAPLHGFGQDLRPDLCDDPGGPGIASQTLNLYVFDQAFQYLHFGYASALLIVLFFIILAGNVVLVSLRGGRA